MVMMLLKRDDINVNVDDNNGFTPLIHASKYNKDRIIETILRKSNIDMNLKDVLNIINISVI